MTTALVTGANRGIGVEICRQLCGRGDNVIAVCRESSPQLDALGVRVEAGIDVADPAAVGELGRRLDGVAIDALWHVAGILRRQALGEIDAAAIEAMLAQYRVNSLAPVLLTQALLGNLHRGSKIAIVTSRMGSIDDNDSGSHYGYRMSKAAVNMAGKSVAVDLRERGIAVALLHPGYVRTGMTEGRGLIDPPESAAGLIARMDALELEHSGGFWHANGERLPW